MPNCAAHPPPLYMSETDALTHLTEPEDICRRGRPRSQPQLLRRSERLDRKYLATSLAAYKVYYYASTRSRLPHSQVLQLLDKALYLHARCSETAKLEYKALVYGGNHKMPQPRTDLGSMYRLVKDDRKMLCFSSIARLEAIIQKHL